MKLSLTFLTLIIFLMCQFNLVNYESTKNMSILYIFFISAYFGLTYYKVIHLTNVTYVSVLLEIN